MRSSRTWPKPDLLQQRRLELGLPLKPAPVPPPLILVFRGGIAGVVLVMLALLTLLGLQHRQQLVQAEIDVLDPVAKRVGDAKARLRAMRSRRSTLEQQTQSIAEQLVAVRSGSALLNQQAVDSGVQMQRYEPLKPPPQTQGQSQRNT